MRRAGPAVPAARGRRDLRRSATVLPVPHTQPWFAGVANLRGGLHGVVDLAGFLGLRAARRQRTTAARQARLVGVQPSAGHQLRVAGRPAGGPAQRRPADARARPTGRAGRAAGLRRRALARRRRAGCGRRSNLAALAGDEQFWASRADACAARRTGDDQREHEGDMSFWTRSRAGPRREARADAAADESQFDDVVTRLPPTSRRAARRRRARRQARGARHAAQPWTRDSSIISEAAPSELTADFTETRLQDAAARAGAAGAALPLIGHLPVAAAAAHPARPGRRRPARPDRWPTVLALSSASRSAAQVAASGQALMQSQRLAKSVSQALIGSAAGLPRSARKAPTCWPQRARAEDRRRQRARPRRRRCRSRSSRCCRWSTAPRRTPTVVLAQQKMLTAGGPGAARDQPPVGRPAGDRPRPCRR